VRHVLPTGAGPVALSQAHQTPPTTSDEATRRWRGFAPHKQAVIDRLLEDQYMLCCYSELRADLYGLGFHIEHIENKSDFPQRTFDWPNLAACTLSSEEGLPKLASQRSASLSKVEVNFGGHAREKQNQVDGGQFVSIRDPQCATYFAYLSNGEMSPNLNRSLADQARVEYTIRVLNLNSPYLVTLRRNLWDDLDALLAHHLENGWSIKHLCQGEITPFGRHAAPHYLPALNSFFSLTRQFFGPVAEQALREYAPELL
jgi:uncharacterized protein (TIGR02646 family)